MTSNKTSIPLQLPESLVSSDASYALWEKKIRDRLVQLDQPLTRDTWDSCPEITDEISLDEYVDILIDRWKEEK